MKKMLFLVFVLANTEVYAQSKKQGNGCIKCNEFEVGEAFELDGFTYTVADRKMLDEALEKGAKYVVIDNPKYYIEGKTILVTGGTGFTARDTTPDALLPLFDQVIEGFGELFRQLSYAEIGTSTIQSRTVAGVANRTVIFSMPGSTGACRTAWDGIIEQQLDSRHKPCNFVEMVTFHAAALPSA